MFIPVLGARRVPIRVKLGLSAFVAVLMFPLVEHTSYIPGIFLFVMTIWREILIGIVLGLVVRLLFGGIQLGGQMMGFKMGFGIVNVFDIQSNQQVSIVTNFIYMLAVLIFLCINGHHVCLVVLAKSFEIVAPGQFHFSSELSHMILALGKDMYIIALKIGFPVTALLIIFNVAMGLVARAVPQINVLIVGFPLQIGLGLFGLGMLIPFFSFFLRDLFSQMGEHMLAILNTM